MRNRLLSAFITLVATLAPLGGATIAHAAGSGLADAPACMFDFKRDFSSRRATEAVIAARNMFLANGSNPLTATALSDANGHLHDAWKNLEQVMNYGLFAFKPCFTCNPGATIGSPPPGWPEGLPWTFQAIADQVASVEIAIHGGPGANKYGAIADALKDNWNSWIGSSDYCGFYAKSRDVSKLNRQMGIRGCAHRQDIERLQSDQQCHPARPQDRRLQRPQRTDLVAGRQ
jgi:hypothetical protein